MKNRTAQKTLIYQPLRYDLKMMVLTMYEKGKRMDIRNIL